MTLQVGTTTQTHVLSLSLNLLSSFSPLYFLSLSTFYLTNSPPVSRSWPRERGRPSTTIRSWRRSTSTTRRSDVLLTTDIYPRTSTTREMSWGSWKRLAVGSTCSLFFLFLGGGDRNWAILSIGMAWRPLGVRVEVMLAWAAARVGLTYAVTLP